MSCPTSEDIVMSWNTAHERDRLGLKKRHNFLDRVKSMNLALRTGRVKPNFKNIPGKLTI